MARDSIVPCERSHWACGRYARLFSAIVRNVSLSRYLLLVFGLFSTGVAGCGGASNRVSGDERDLSEIGCLGVEFGPQTEEEGATGVIVTRVITNSPADQSGVLPGDRLTRVDGRRIKDAARFRWLRRAWRPNQTIKLEFVRGDAMREASVQLIDGIELRSLYYVEELK